MKYQMFKLVLEKAEEPEIQMPIILDNWKGKKVPENKTKQNDFCFIDSAKDFDCVDHYKLEDSERDGNTRPPELSLEKPICISGSNN